MIHDTNEYSSPSRSWDHDDSPSFEKHEKMKKKIKNQNITIFFSQQTKNYCGGEISIYVASNKFMASIQRRQNFPIQLYIYSRILLKCWDNPF